MRLTPQEIEVIKTAVAAIDPSAQVYLFGSRADDRKFGGDIDLVVVSDRFDLDAIILAKVRIKDKIGEQKIDLIAAPIDASRQSAFVKEAILKGILL